jgi:uncharacterized membrane protein (DUF106 family)
MTDIISSIINFFAGPIQGLCPASPVAPSFCIATSTVVIIAAALLLSLMTSSANRFLVNYKMVTSYRREYMSWTQAVRKAKKDGDEKQLDKLLKKQSAMVKMSTRANLEQMKTTAITFIPLLLVYRVLLSAFPLTTAVAYSPLFFPGAAETTFGVFKAGIGFFSMVYWYFLSSFAIGIPLSRLFGIQQFSLNPGDTGSK